MYNVLIVLHLLITVFLIGAVLIQSGRGASTANIFGGGRAAENVFGASTPAILNKVTAVLATAFIVTSITLTIMAGERRRPILDRMLQDERRAPSAVTETVEEPPYMPAENGLAPGETPQEAPPEMPTEEAPPAVTPPEFPLESLPESP